MCDGFKNEGFFIDFNLRFLFPPLLLRFETLEGVVVVKYHYLGYFTLLLHRLFYRYFIALWRIYDGNCRLFNFNFLLIFRFFLHIGWEYCILVEE